MINEYKYSKYDVCKLLGITIYTIENWYRWESKAIADGLVLEKYLPRPIKLNNLKGRPLRWSFQMVEELRLYKDSIIHGRNGIYGRYTNAAWH